MGNSLSFLYWETSRGSKRCFDKTHNFFKCKIGLSIEFEYILYKMHTDRNVYLLIEFLSLLYNCQAKRREKEISSVSFLNFH